MCACVCVCIFIPLLVVVVGMGKRMTYDVRCLMRFDALSQCASSFDFLIGRTASQAVSQSVSQSHSLPIIQSVSLSNQSVSQSFSQSNSLLLCLLLPYRGRTLRKSNDLFVMTTTRRSLLLLLAFCKQSAVRLA